MSDSAAFIFSIIFVGGLILFVLIGAIMKLRHFDRRRPQCSATAYGERCMLSVKPRHYEHEVYIDFPQRDTPTIQWVGKDKFWVREDV